MFIRLKYKLNKNVNTEVLFPPKTASPEQNGIFFSYAVNKKSHRQRQQNVHPLAAVRALVKTVRARIIARVKYRVNDRQNVKETTS